jgi:hypothetical protein
VVELHQEAGAERILFHLPSEGGRDAVLPLLDELAGFVGRLG